MARVFVGSTAYDLGDVRQKIVDCLRSMGHVPIYFESPNFPVPIGMHAHDVCIRAVEQCDVYLLIINKRYGGTYTGELYPEMAGKSITHAETLHAITRGKRVYTFVCQATWDERIVHKKKPNTKTVYVDNPRVFDLIDVIHHRKIDNWMWFFKDFVELRSLVSSVLGTGLIDEILNSYKSKLPFRFRDELRQFEELGYIPITLTKYQQHANPTKSLETKYGFSILDALEQLESLLAIHDSQEPCTVEHAKAVFSISSLMEPSPQAKEAEEALAYFTQQGITLLSDGIERLKGIIQSEYETADIASGEPLDAIVKKNPRLIIIGEPGSGKTTSCYRLTQLDPAAFSVDNIFFLRATAFRRFLDVLANGETYIQALPMALQSDLDIHTARMRTHMAELVAESVRQTLLGSWEGQLVSALMIHDTLMKGRSLVLIDGLNELGPLSDRLVAELELATSDHASGEGPGYGTNRFVFTTRRYNDPITRLPDCPRYEILPLRDEAIEAMISRVPHCESLREEVKRLSPELRRNPLFLDMAIGIYRKSGRIPYNWGAVFESFLKGFLDGWEEKNLQQHSEIVMGEARPALEELAFRMTSTNRVQMDWTDASAVIRTISGCKGEYLEALVSYLLNGRIVRREGADLRFMGQPLQEFLTAACIKKRLDCGAVTVADFYDSIESGGNISPQWYGVLFLLVNQLSLDQIWDLTSVIEKDENLRKLSGSVVVHRPETFRGQVVVKVTNYYCNAEAQEEAYKIFDHLYRHYGLKIICVEGADGEIDTSWFRAFPDAKIKAEVAAYFVKKGKITAPEYLSITADYPVLLYGLEDRNVYISLLNQETGKGSSDDEQTRKPATMSERQGLLVKNTYELLVREDLRFAGFYYGGGGLLGQIWPRTFTDKGTVYIEIDTKTKGVNWDLHSKVLRNEKTSFEEILMDLQEGEHRAKDS